MEDLKSELHGNLEEAVEALMLPAPVYDAKTLRNAMRVFHDRGGSAFVWRSADIVVKTHSTWHYDNSE